MNANVSETVDTEAVKNLFDGLVLLCVGPEKSIEIREYVLRHFRRILNGGNDPKGHSNDLPSKKQDHPGEEPAQPFRSHVLLSTCDRVELYIYDEKRLLTDLLRENADFDVRLLQEINGEEAVRHLFRVASGLESPLLGENQILGQVRDAYELARTKGQAGGLYHRLFQAAISTGRFVRAASGLNRGAVSHAQALQAMLLNEELLSPSTRFVFVGANELLEKVLKFVRSKGLNAVLLGNRSHERAVEMIAKHGGESFSMDELPRVLAHADVLISATSAPHYIVRSEHLSSRTTAKPLRVFDLAVPRDVDPGIAAGHNVTISTVDEIEQTAFAAVENRKKKLPAAEAELERCFSDMVEREMRRQGLTQYFSKAQT